MTDSNQNARAQNALALLGDAHRRIGGRRNRVGIAPEPKRPLVLID